MPLSLGLVRTPILATSRGLSLSAACIFLNLTALQFKGLIKTLDITDHNIKRIDDEHSFLLKYTSINKVEPKRGDVLRREESKYEEVINAAIQLNNKLY